MKTTNYAQASYQEIIDLHTEPGGMSVLGIHTPTGDAPYQMFKGFFDQFRKFTYLGASFSLVPAARLPSDIAGVSYGAGETAETVAPEDLLNPIMFKGCHGNDMGTILNTMYTAKHGTSLAGAISPSLDMNIMAGLNPSASGYDYATEFYYSCLTDNTWLKAHPQSGLRKNGLRPLVYQMASTMPMGISANGRFGSGQLDSNYAGYPLEGSSSGNDLYGFGDDPTASANPSSEPSLFHGARYPSWPDVADISDGDLGATQWYGGQATIFTPRLTRLGWMDTYTWGSNSTGAIGEDTSGSFNQNMKEWFGKLDNLARSVTKLPRIFMGMILMPPAIGHQQYYRLMINHRFAWKDFRGISGGKSNETINQQRWDFNGLEA